MQRESFRNIEWEKLAYLDLGPLQDIIINDVFGSHQKKLFFSVDYLGYSTVLKFGGSGMPTSALLLDCL